MISRLTARQAERLFITISCIELFMGLLGYCQVTLPFSKYILWIFTLVYVAIAATNKYSAKEKAVLIILIIFGVLLYANSGLSSGIRRVCYLYALKNIDMKKYLRAALSVLVGSSFSFAVCSAIGLLDIAMQDVRPYRGFGGVRYTFGYYNPNITMAVIFLALICWFALYHGEQPWYAYVAIMAAYAVLFYFTDSRTAFFMGGGVMIGIICTRHIKWSGWTNLIFVIFIISFISMLVISVAAAFRVENTLMHDINLFISKRMSQLNVCTVDENYALPFVENWHLFGDRGNRNLYDLGYLQLFYYYGIIPAICYLLCVVCAAVKVWRENNTLELILLLGLSVQLFMEPIYLCGFIPIDFLLVYSVLLLWRDSSPEY